LKISAKKTKIKVGDKIIKCSKVYKIFKIKKKKIAGHQQTIILYKPYFKTAYNQSLIFSLPLKALEKANIRPPVTKKKLKIFFKNFSVKTEKDPIINIVNTREVLSRNNFGEIIGFLKTLIKEKKAKKLNFTKSRQEILNLTVSCLAEEVALVGGFSLPQAEKKIYQALN